MLYRSSRSLIQSTSCMALLACSTLLATWSVAQEEAPPANRSSVNRLPPHYSKVVTPEQRTKIYAIQQEFAPQIQELRRQLDRLIAERDMKARDVLTADQQRLLDELVEMARQQREKRRAGSASQAAN